MKYLSELKNYDKGSPKVFKVEPGELDATYVYYPVDEKEERVLTYFNKFVDGKVVSYRCIFLPDEMKRFKGDTARLIVLYMEDGSIFAKRHNNSQYIVVGSETSVRESNGAVQ